MERQQYLDSKVKPIMENLVFKLVCERPENPASFMIDWLQKTGGYTTNGLTFDEKYELETLRKEIIQYREREGYIDEAANSEDEDHEDEEDDKVTEQELKRKQVKGKLRMGVSAEVYGKFNAKADFKPRFIKKNENQMQRIKSKILQSFIFGNLDPKDIDVVIGAMEEKIFTAGDCVINQGDNGDCLYVVESGELDCYKAKGGEDKEKVYEYSSGGSFGELSLLYNAPRAATVIARSNCVLWALDRETFNNIVKDAARKKREQYETFLKTVGILSTLIAYELTQICDALKTCHFKAGDYVIRQGELGDVFYIVEQGEAVATITDEPGKPAKVVLDYKKGGYFGELALIKGEPRAANIVASVY